MLHKQLATGFELAIRIVFHIPFLAFNILLFGGQCYFLAIGLNL